MSGTLQLQAAINSIREKYIISYPGEKHYFDVKKHWDSIAKPLDGLGRFEEMVAAIGWAQGTDDVAVGERAVIIMCADNGVVSQGVSQSGQEVTAAVAASIGRNESSVCRMAAFAGARVVPVDIGIASNEKIDGVIDAKIRTGTRDFTIEPAMTVPETLRAIQVGVEIVEKCAKSGIRLIATGEMGIGNTTTSSAVAAALLGQPADSVVGRGAGLSDSALWKKRKVVKESIDKYDLYSADAFRILQTVGGLDIAGLTGVFIGGAVYHIPIIIDGLISAAAALTAEYLIPGVRRFMLASHIGKEPAMAKLLERLELKPVICADMALGEGTGAVMLFPLLDMAMSVYAAKTQFSRLGIEPYTRFDGEMQ